MPSDTRTAAEIERDIERERVGLADSLEDLQDKFSVEAFARQMTDQFREHGGDIGRSVSNSIKENPIALTLTGVGLAWMIFGNGSGRDRYSEHSRTESGLSGLDASVDRFHPTPYDARPAPHARRNLPNWARDDLSPAATGHRTGVFEGRTSRADQASGGPSSAASKANQGLHAAGRKVSDAARSTADTVSGAASSARESVASGAHETSEQMARLRERLAEGTEAMSEEARARVVEARRRALEARDAAMEYSRKSRERAEDIFEEQPLVAGAVALAIGALLGAALPRTRVEDKHLGRQSDHLFDEAERIYNEEKDKLAKVAKTAGKEAKTVAREKKSELDARVSGESVAETVVSEAKTSGKRVAKAAKSEAKKQDLGGSGKL